METQLKKSLRRRRTKKAPYFEIQNHPYGCIISAYNNVMGYKRMTHTDMEAAINALVDQIVRTSVNKYTKKQQQLTTKTNMTKEDKKNKFAVYQQKIDKIQSKKYKYDLKKEFRGENGAYDYTVLRKAAKMVNNVTIHDVGYRRLSDLPKILSESKYYIVMVFKGIINGIVDQYGHALAYVDGKWLDSEQHPENPKTPTTRIPKRFRIRGEQAYVLEVMKN